MINQHITISGELGSGKSSLAHKLAEAYGRRLVAGGDMYRSIAQSKELSILETNLLAEKDAEIDRLVDGALKELGELAEPIIFDSRLAWNLVESAFKVHLLVDAGVAADRLHLGRSTSVEDYVSHDEARAAADQRFQSERRRYLSTYGVDTARLRNYNLVIDTSYATLDEAVEAVQSSVAAAENDLSSLRIKVSPRRVLPGPSLPEIMKDRLVAFEDSVPTVIYFRPFFVAVNNHDKLSSALQNQETFIDVQLLAENEEQLEDGLTAENYVGSLSADFLTKWEHQHGFQFPSRPTAVHS